MKYRKRLPVARGFHPLIDSRSAQVAVMTLGPGEKSDSEVTNEHPRCEQWIFVSDGHGHAKIGNRKFSLEPGSILLIGKKERHQIINSGRKQLITINFYVPKAYDYEGRVRRTAKL